jgi:hypothetical protein
MDDVSVANLVREQMYSRARLGGCIMQVTLTPQEHDLIVRILERHHQALLKEIWHTDKREFKAALQADEKQLAAILERMLGVVSVER